MSSDIYASSRESLWGNFSNRVIKGKIQSGGGWRRRAEGEKASSTMLDNKHVVTCCSQSNVVMHHYSWACGVTKGHKKVMSAWLCWRHILSSATIGILGNFGELFWECVKAALLEVLWFMKCSERPFGLIQSVTWGARSFFETILWTSASLLNTSVLCTGKITSTININNVET